MMKIFLALMLSLMTEALLILPFLLPDKAVIAVKGTTTQWIQPWETWMLISVSIMAFIVGAAIYEFWCFILKNL